MTISTTVRKAGPYEGNDSATTFPFAFKVFDKADLRVILTDTLGVEHALALEDNYSVRLNVEQENMPGGDVIMPVPLASGNKITLLSALEYKQPVRLTNMGGFYPEVINDEFDRLTILSQQLLEQINRSVKVKVSDNTDPDELIASLKDSAPLAQEAARKAKTSATQAAGSAAQAEIVVNSAVAAAISKAAQQADRAQQSANDARNHALSVLKVGDQKLSPFRSEAFWYLMNGDNFLLTSPQGQALNGLSADYKADWGIVVSVVNGQNVINVPNYFDAAGNGYFDRAVNGTNRRVGSRQGDAMRNITGWAGFNVNDYAYGWWGASGAFRISEASTHKAISSATNTATNVNFGFTFEPWLVVPTASENRPANIGKTPLIYLGV